MRLAIASPLVILLISEIAMAQDKPTNFMGDVTNNQGIITQGQIGDNYIIQFKAPTVRIIGYREPTKNSDGSFTHQLVFRLESQAPANSLLVAVKEEDVLLLPDSHSMRGIYVVPVSGGATMGSSGQEQGYLWQKIQSPSRGDYVLNIRASGATVRPRVQIQVE